MPKILDASCLFETGETITRIGVLDEPDAVLGADIAKGSSVAPMGQPADMIVATSSQTPQGEDFWFDLRSVVTLSPNDALHWRILEFISGNAGVRVEQIVKRFQIGDPLAFEIVNDLRERGLVGPA